MDSYKRWVRRNRDYVHSLESLANGLTWLLPERFSDSEIGPEAGFVKFCDISSGHDYCSQRTYNQYHPSADSYRVWRAFIFLISLCITLLKDLETLVEVVAQHLYGEDNKWKFIAITEAAKVLLRLAALQKSGYKMLLHGGESTNYGRDSDYFDAQGNEFASNPGQHGISGDLSNNHGQDPYTLEGRALFALNRFGENARTVTGPSWFHRVQHQEAMMEPPTTVSETPTLYTFLSKKGTPGGLFFMGEVLFILRPLIYVLLIRKYGTRSWLPWLASLVVDLIGNGSSSLVSVLWHNGQVFHLSNLEKHELKRRKLLWALYLMRDPFFTKYTSQRLAGTQKLLEPVPLIGLLTEKLVELLVGAQTRYTYMSGS